jgi:hypothetical protein
MSEGCIRIEVLSNGYTVSVDDPMIRKSNDARDNSSMKGPYKPWVDPERKFAFTTEKQVVDFITKNLKKVIPAKKADYETSFDVAAAAPEKT